MSEPATRPLPLFYRQPQPLIPAIHNQVRLKDGDYRFAEESNAIPLAVIEFASAMRHYPVVFSQDDGFPLAVVGLGRRNRFVAAGDWAEDHYVPAYARRYPFVFIEVGAGKLTLGLDVDSGRVADDDEEGSALFADGRPTSLTENAMAFCSEFHGAHVQTIAFAAALKAHDLLVPQQADAILDSGTPLILGGFLVVDRKKFAELADDIVLAWHRNGWLALVHFHLASLDRFVDLLGRESGVETPTPVIGESFAPATGEKSKASPLEEN